MNTMGKETAKIATPNMIAIAKKVQARQLVMGLPPLPIVRTSSEPVPLVVFVFSRVPYQRGWHRLPGNKPQLFFGRSR